MTATPAPADQPTGTRSIHVDQFIAAPPARVWRALTVPDGLASWWAPGDIRAEVGHRFMLEMQGWGQVPCEVLEVDPERRLVMRFTDDWVITFVLEPEGSGSRLLLEHSGFDLDDPGHRFAFEQMGPGWTDEVLPRLAQAVEAAG
jgi:uncharacterized protein YndB with AHSA1/START domain